MDYVRLGIVTGESVAVHVRSYKKALTSLENRKCFVLLSLHENDIMATTAPHPYLEVNKTRNQMIWSGLM